MRKVIVVAVREYLAAVRTKAFIITILLMPVLMGSGFIAERFLGDASMDISDRRIAVIDHSGALYDTLASAAELRNTRDIYSGTTETDGPKQILPRFLLERVQPDHDSLGLEEGALAHLFCVEFGVRLGVDGLGMVHVHSAGDRLYFFNRLLILNHIGDAPGADAEVR